MILLDSDASLECVLAGAITTNQGVLYASYADHSTSAFTPGMRTTATNSTTAVTWVGAPGSANVTRQVKFLSLYNADTASMTATVRVVDSSTNRTLVKVTLAAGERLEYTDGHGFTVFDANGASKHGAVTSVNGSTGAVTLGGESIAEPVTALASSGAISINCALGDYFTIAATGNLTSFTFSNLPAAGKAQTLMIRITQDATGSRTATWPSSFKWAGGTAGVLSTTANSVDVLAITTFDQGTTWNATLAKAFA